MKKANDLDTNYLFEVRTKKTTFIFNVSEIVYLESNGCYTLLKLQNKSILVSKTLKYFEDNLPINLFIRCHNCKQELQMQKNGK